MKDELGDRMKRYEVTTKQYLPRRTYSVIRVDGKAFHTYTKGLDEPFDDNFVQAMNHTAAKLCEQIQGAVMAYVQSDEISILLMDMKTPNTSAWYDGNVLKQVAVSASITTDEFNRKILEQKFEGYMGNLPGKVVSEMKRAQFDSRVFTIPDPVEVVNYFIWRQNDCIRNSLSAIARSLFSHSQLDGKNSVEKREMIEGVGKKVSEYPEGCLRGRVVQKNSRKVPVTYARKDTGQEETQEAVRTFWDISDAPNFKDSSEMIYKVIKGSSAVRVREGTVIGKTNSLGQVE